MFWYFFVGHKIALIKLPTNKPRPKPNAKINKIPEIKLPIAVL